jgi:prepilin-type N-terminal cleavage/methylation domain-containing protein
VNSNTRSSRQLPRPGFTLVECLVLLAVAAIFVAIVLTGLSRGRASAQRSECQNRLRNLATAVFQFESRAGCLPPGAISGPFAPFGVPEDVMHGLWGVLLPEIDDPAAAMRYRWQVPYNDPSNDPITSRTIPILMCPVWPTDRTAEWGPDRMAGIADFAPLEVNPFLADIAAVDPSDNFEGPLPVNGTVKMTEIRDGLANTILLVEASGRPGMAWSSSDIPVSVRSIIGTGAHMAATNVIHCDGSIRCLRADIDIRLLARLATRNGGEVIDAEW